MAQDISGHRFQLLSEPQTIGFGEHQGKLQVHLGEFFWTRDDDGYIKAATGGRGAFIINAEEIISAWSKMEGSLCLLSGSDKVYRISSGSGFDARSWYAYLEEIADASHDSQVKAEIAALTA